MLGERGTLPSQAECPLRVAVLKWSEQDGISDALCYELAKMEHEVVTFVPSEPLPGDVDILLTHGPHGDLLSLLRESKARPSSQHPVTVHWNTEGWPDLRTPPWLLQSVAAWRSWLGRLQSRRSPSKLARHRLVALGNRYLQRFRYVGDYTYACRTGLLDCLFDSSRIYAALHLQRSGISVGYAPWGATPLFYEDLGLERDVDVLWMGKRGTRRRSQLLDQIRGKLARHGVEMLVFDNEERPFIYGDERTEYLNRARITINLTRTWYDDNYSRFALAAPNRSLIVSEALLPHCPAFEEGVHYAAAPASQVAATILYYLRNEEERRALAESGYRLVTTKLRFEDSVRKMIGAGAARVKERGRRCAPSP